MQYHITAEREITENDRNGKLTVVIGEKQAREIFEQVLRQMIADDIREYGSACHPVNESDAGKMAETVIRFYDPDISYWNNIERAFDYLESDIRGKRSLQ